MDRYNTVRLSRSYTHLLDDHSLTSYRISTARRKMPLFRETKCCNSGSTTHLRSCCFCFWRPPQHRERQAVQCSFMLYDDTPRLPSPTTVTHRQSNADALTYLAQMVCSVCPTSDIGHQISILQYLRSGALPDAGMAVRLDRTRFSVSISVLFQIPIHRLPSLWALHFVHAVLFALLLSCLMHSFVVVGRDCMARMVLCSSKSKVCFLDAATFSAVLRPSSHTYGVTR